ncbi:MAG TPA: ribosomal protein S18-alanine N-acetyltransferase [Candidatus Cloacimonas sp.]|nr:ribosomal protein S18-alanine N-acetyltransferase [Candidatus Cloacimonas sp.]
MDDSFRISIAVPSDIDAFQEIEKQVFSNPWPREAFSGMLFSWFFTLLREDEVIGYIIYSGGADEMVIVNFAVRPDFQGKGLGEYLLTETMRMMYDRGIRYFYLDVRMSNFKAHSLYKKVGFEDIGIRKNYYNKPDEDAIVMGMKIK